MKKKNRRACSGSMVAGQRYMLASPSLCATQPPGKRTFFCQAEDGIRAYKVTGVQTCALPISTRHRAVVWPTALEVRHAGRGTSTRVDLGGVQVLSMRCGPGPGQRTRPCGDPTD